jgi:hypothetical protein
MEKILTQGSYELLDVCNYTLKIDTTNFNLVDYEKIYMIIETNFNQNYSDRT